MTEYLYSLVNKITGSTYFGVTNNFKRRMNEHQRGVLGGNRKLYNSIRKYGWDNFEIDIVMIVKCRSEVLELEKFYIAEFDTFKNGLNSTTGGDGASTGSDHCFATPIILKDIDTEEEIYFDCMKYAVKWLGLSSSSGISAILDDKCSQKQVFTKDKKRRFAVKRADDPSIWDLAIFRLEKKIKMRDIDSKKNDDIIFDSIKEGAIWLGVKSGNLSAVLRGKCNQVCTKDKKRRFAVKYKDDATPWVLDIPKREEAKNTAVISYDEHGNYVAEYPSVRAAGRAFGNRSGNIISSSVNHKSWYANGLLWEFKDINKRPKYDRPPRVSKTIYVFENGKRKVAAM